MFNPKLLKITDSFALFSVINLDILFLHTEYRDDNINLPFLVFIIFELILSVSFLLSKQEVFMLVLQLILLPYLKNTIKSIIHPIGS